MQAMHRRRQPKSDTKPSPILRVREAEAAAKSRLVAIRLASLTLRCMENWRRVAGGYDETMILLGVVAITAEKLLRADLPEELKSLSTPMPPDDFGRCSIASIAVATGLNRETVRRKLNRLVELGFLVRTDDGSVRFAPGVAQDEQIHGLIQSQLHSFRQLSESLLQEEILELVER